MLWRIVHQNVDEECCYFVNSASLSALSPTINAEVHLNLEKKSRCKTKKIPAVFKFSYRGAYRIAGSYRPEESNVDGIWNMRSELSAARVGRLMRVTRILRGTAQYSVHSHGSSEASTPVVKPREQKVSAENHSGSLWLLLLPVSFRKDYIPHNTKFARLIFAIPFDRFIVRVH